MQNIVLVARWPVGGIRTYLRYVYRLFDPDEFQLILISPETAETAHIAGDIGAPLGELYTCGSRPDQMIRAIRKVCCRAESAIVHAHGLSAAIFTSIALLGVKGRLPYIATLHDVFLPTHFVGITGHRTASVQTIGQDRDGLDPLFNISGAPFRSSRQTLFF